MSSQDSISPPATRQNEAHATAEHPDHSGSAPQGRKKRVRNWTADDRAAHRVFERSRREAFKGRLTTLANLIPALQSTDTNRLSKHVVLDESIALHRVEQQKLKAIVQQVDTLLEEREELLTEVNRWRAGAGLGMREARILEPLPEPNTSPTDHPSTDQTQPDPEEMQPPVPPTSLHAEQENDALGPFDTIPQPIPPLNPAGVVGHPGVPPAGWEVMGMDMNSQGMDVNMGYNDLFAQNMVNYAPVVKPPGPLDSTSYMPSEPPYPQQPMNIINPQYSGDPRVYGQ
ncbi:hypothetical protein LIA77_07997 [Sarocladium implicatum]|nr:hypothetical protein LIA77_07997 [Sarocladium implicatum]